MINLISSKAVRLLRILEEGYFNQQVSIDSIANLNNCSKNTVHADLALLELNWPEKLKIDVGSLSFSIGSISTGDLIRIKETILREETSVQLLFNIFFKPNFTIYDHSLDLNYSESHLRKTIRKLNKFLEVINTQIEYIKIDNDSKPIINTEDELLLCHFIANFFLMTNYEDTFITDEEVEISVFETLLNESNLPISFPMRKFFNVLAKVSYTRYSQGFCTREELMKQYEEMFKDRNMREFIEIFNETLDNELKSYFGKMYLEQHQSDFKAMNDLLITLLLRIIVFNKNIDTILNRYNIFYQRFSTEHGRAFGTFNETLDHFKVIIGKDYEEYYGEIIYNLYIHLPNIRPGQSYQIGVYSDLGKIHAYSLIQTLNLHFPTHTIETFQEDEYYDFVISTVSDEEQLEAYDEILISDLIGSDDINNIYTAIYNRFKKNPN